MGQEKYFPAPSSPVWGWKIIFRLFSPFYDCSYSFYAYLTPRIIKPIKSNIMSTFPRIKEARLYSYNNAEYLNFLRRFRSRMPLRKGGEEDRPGELSLLADEPLGAPDLGISAGQVTEMDGYLEQLTELNNQSRISQETASRIETDRQRDKVAVYILNRINGASALPLQSEREAGIFLANIVKPYTGISRLAFNQETETIKGLLVDLRKEENKTAVDALALTPYMEELERLNNLFVTLTEQRTTAQINSAIDNSKIIRAKADSLYEDMTDLAFAWSLAHPSDAASNFIRDVNALIDEAQASLHQRKPSGKKDDEGTEGGNTPDDRPGELSN